jgi:hypothetical protein
MNPPNPTSSTVPPSSSTADTGVRPPTAGAKTSEQPSSAASEAAGKIRQRAKNVLTGAKDTIGRVVLDQKDAAADRVGGYSSAIHESARALEQDDPNVAHFANQAADRIEEAADYIRNSDFARLRQDAEGVARRHPALFMGGMLLAGLVLGNLAKASRQELGEDNRDRSGDSEDKDFTDPGYENPIAEEDPLVGDERRGGSYTSEGFSPGSAATGF